MSEQEQEIILLRGQLAEAMKFVNLVSQDWYVAGELWHVCFFCRAFEPEEDGEHEDNCPVLVAKRLLEKLKEVGA